MTKYVPIAKRLMDAVEGYDLDPVSELVCDILQVFSIEDKIVKDDKRVFVFEDHSAAALTPSEGLLAADVKYAIEVDEDDDEDDDDEEDEEEEEEEESVVGISLL